MLGSLKPIVIGIVAGATPELKRGKVYSVLQVFLAIGAMLAVQVATPLSVRLVFGVVFGWRVAFIAFGAFAGLTGLLICACMDEAKATGDIEPDTSCYGKFKVEVNIFGAYLKMPSFVCLVLQGMIGAVPWQGFNYNTLYFQMTGLSSAAAASLNTIFALGFTVGTMLGGIIGDALAKRCPNSGRPFTANMSVAAGIPLAFLIFVVPPPTGWQPFWWYGFLLMVMGLTASWTCTGVNWPILAELVDVQRSSSILAWESALESSVAAIAGNAAVGFLAMNVFGYNLEDAKHKFHAGGSDPSNAHALGMAISLTALPPWVLCFLFYIVLHWAYPHDKKRLARGNSSTDCCSSSSGSSSEASEDE